MPLLPLKIPKLASNIEDDNALGAYYLQPRGRLSVPQSKLPVRASQDHKGKEQAEEDGYKDNVCPQRAN